MWPAKSRQERPIDNRPAGWQPAPLGCLLYVEHPVAADVLQRLHDSRWPMDDHRRSRPVGAQSEMHGPITGRRIAHAGGHVVVLRAALGRNLYPGADTVA